MLHVLRGLEGIARIRGGFDAANATLKLMFDAQQRLAPLTIIDADDPDLGPTARAQRLWNNDTVKNATITSLAESVKVLATLWQAAWREGGGESLAQNKLVEFSTAALIKIYRTEADFVPSLNLDDMAASGDYEPPTP